MGGFSGGVMGTGATAVYHANHYDGGGANLLTPEEIAAYNEAEQERIQQEELFAEIERDWYADEEAPVRTEETADDWDDLFDEEEQYESWLKSIGAENSGLSTLEKYNEAKYNNTEEYRLFEQYAKDVESGWISPLSGFDNYKTLYYGINNEIVGKKAVNDILITGQVPHFMQRVIGTMVDPKKMRDDLEIIRRSGVEIEDVKKALFAPKSVGERIIKENGKTSIRFTGEKCHVSINPDTGELIQTNPRKG